MSASTTISAAAQPSDHFMGFPVFVDRTLAPGTCELRSGKEVVRVINLHQK